MITVKKLLIALSLLLAALGLALWLYPRLGHKQYRNALAQRVLATHGLADFLVSHGAGKKALILANPFTQRPGRPAEIYDFEAAGLEGLRRGFGKTIALGAIEYPALRPDYLRNPDSVRIAPQTTTPLSYLVAEDAFDMLAQRHPDCDLVVSLIGLPANLRRVQLWQKSGGPRLALLLPDLRLIGDQAAVRAAFRSGKIAATVLNKPGAPAEDIPIGRDTKAEFERRYLLVTADTIDSLIKAYPQLF
jgi:hypothetical protein